MASSENRRIAVMSIFPEFAEKILNGTKQIEFRKRKLAPDVDFVLLYATCPVARLVGYFTITGYDVDHPEALWQRHQAHAGIDYQRYSNYYAGVSQAVGIRFANPTKLEQEFTLDQISPYSKPPQSFMYIEADQVNLEFLPLPLLLDSHWRGSCSAKSAAPTPKPTTARPFLTHSDANAASHI